MTCFGRTPLAVCLGLALLPVAPAAPDAPVAVNSGKDGAAAAVSSLPPPREALREIRHVPDLMAVKENLTAREAFIEAYPYLAYLLSDWPACDPVFRVLDQHDRPVAGVTVSCHVSADKFVPLRCMYSQEITMTTDTEGYATCHLPPCHGFDAGTVRKFGYEDTSRQDMQWANADRADKGKAAADAFRAKLEGSSRVQSYVLRIRDRGHLTLVLWSSGRCSLPLPKAGEAGAAVSKRLFKHEYGMPPNWAATMAFAPALDQASETVTVTALPPDGKGGILYSDKELTEAPADGYLPSVSFAMLKKSTGHSAAATHFLYFRAAAPAVYGSIEISLSDARWKADRVEFPIAVKVNPYGGHTFEAIDWKFRPPVEKQALLSALQDKAGKALEEGHLAEEPNFRELLGLPDLK